MTNSINNTRSQVLTLAHKLKAENCSFGQAQKLAWKAIRAKHLLRNEVCILKFIKADGTTSTKTATLQAEFLPAQKTTTGAARKRTSTKITFWSLTDQNFRSFLPGRFISIASIKIESRIFKAA